MEWINVKEALPNIEQDVLIWDGFEILISCLLDDEGEGYAWEIRGNHIDEVTHWMPLPPKPNTDVEVKITV